MGEQYSNYILEHKENVKKAFEWIKAYLSDMFDDDTLLLAEKNISDHDNSKFEESEYIPYEKYFYGNNRSYEVVDEFRKAWLLHIHRNPHHWQYWILRNDDPDEGEILLDMPDCYILEMICDWWSFSWKQEKLNEIFKWYLDHKNYIKFSDYTRKKVENILQKINVILNYESEESKGYNGEKEVSI